MQEQGSSNVIVASAHRQILRQTSQDAISKSARIRRQVRAASRHPQKRPILHVEKQVVLTGPVHGSVMLWLVISARLLESGSFFRFSLEKKMKSWLQTRYLVVTFYIVHIVLFGIDGFISSSLASSTSFSPHTLSHVAFTEVQLFCFCQFVFTHHHLCKKVQQLDGC